MCNMSLLKELVVLSALLVASSYGHSQRVGGRGRVPRKWTAAGRDRTPMDSDRLARIKYWYHYVPEVKYRLDEVPCSGPALAMPPENEVYNYYAPVQYNVWHSYYYCDPIKLPTAPGTLEPSDGGSYDLRSPGTDYNYPSRRLSYYHIHCPGEIEFFIMEKFSLQNKIRISYNQKKCVDYVKISDMNNMNIHEEFCGTYEHGSRLGTNIYGSNVLVTFRSSSYNNNYPGFEIRANCSSTGQVMENCLKVENSEYAAVRQTVDKWTRKSVPKYTLSELQAFLRSREQGGDVWIMSDEEAVWNADMLSLAVLSEHSCAAEYRRAGKAVLELFPKWMVKKERESFKKDGVFNM